MDKEIKILGLVIVGLFIIFLISGGITGQAFFGLFGKRTIQTAPTSVSTAGSSDACISVKDFCGQHCTGEIYLSHSPAFCSAWCASQVGTYDATVHTTCYHNCLGVVQTIVDETESDTVYSGGTVTCNCKYGWARCDWTMNCGTCCGDIK